jgi:hypothetical protein
MLFSTPPAIYKVAEGDSLWSISQKIWHDPQLWSALYGNNSNIIGSNPNYILPGELLEVPANPKPSALVSEDPPTDYTPKHASVIIPVYTAKVSTDSGGTLDCSQLENLWDENGGNPNAAFTAAEIAMAESSGEQYATGPFGERGYWQINPVWGSLSSYDPNTNAHAAIVISYDGTNWSAWTTYVTGQYEGQC